MDEIDIVIAIITIIIIIIAPIYRWGSGSKTDCITEGPQVISAVLGAELWYQTQKPVLSPIQLQSPARHHSHLVCVYFVNSGDSLYHKARFGALVFDLRNLWWNEQLCEYGFKFFSCEFFLFMSINNLGTNSLCINHFMNNWYDMYINPNATYRVSIF